MLFFLFLSTHQFLLFAKNSRTLQHQQLWVILVEESTGANNHVSLTLYSYGVLSPTTLVPLSLVRRLKQYKKLSSNYKETLLRGKQNNA